MDKYEKFAEAVRADHTYYPNGSPIFSISTIAAFANVEQIPILLQEECPRFTISLLCFEKDEQKIKDFYFEYRPCGIELIITTVPNQIGTTQQQLLEYKEK